MSLRRIGALAPAALMVAAIGLFAARAVEQHAVLQSKLDDVWREVRWSITLARDEPALRDEVEKTALEAYRLTQTLRQPQVMEFLRDHPYHPCTMILEDHRARLGLAAGPSPKMP